MHVPRTMDSMVTTQERGNSMKLGDKRGIRYDPCRAIWVVWASVVGSPSGQSQKPRRRYISSVIGSPLATIPQMF